MLQETAHLSDLGWTEDKQATLNTLVQRYSAQGASGAGRVHRWRLECVSLVLGDKEDRNDLAGQTYDQWPLGTWVDSPIFRYLRGKFL
jgi:hypothetical protein